MRFLHFQACAIAAEAAFKWFGLLKPGSFQDPLTSSPSHVYVALISLGRSF